MTIPTPARNVVDVTLGHCPDVPAASELGDRSYIAYLRIDDVALLEFGARAAGRRVVPLSAA